MRSVTVEISALCSHILVLFERRLLMHQDILYASGVTFGLKARLSSARYEVIDTAATVGPLIVNAESNFETDRIGGCCPHTDVSRNILSTSRA